MCTVMNDLPVYGTTRIILYWCDRPSPCARLQLVRAVWDLFSEIKQTRSYTTS